MRKRLSFKSQQAAALDQMPLGPRTRYRLQHPPMDDVTAALYGTCREAYESAHTAARVERERAERAEGDRNKARSLMMNAEGVAAGETYLREQVEQKLEMIEGLLVAYGDPEPDHEAAFEFLIYQIRSVLDGDLLPDRSEWKP